MKTKLNPSTAIRKTRTNRGDHTPQKSSNSVIAINAGGSIGNNSDSETSLIEEDERMQRRRIALNKFRKGALAAASGLYMKRMLRVSDEENAAKVAEELRERMGKMPTQQWAGPSK